MQKCKETVFEFQFCIIITLYLIHYHVTEVTINLLKTQTQTILVKHHYHTVQISYKSTKDTNPFQTPLKVFVVTATFQLQKPHDLVNQLPFWIQP